MRQKKIIVDCNTHGFFLGGARTTFPWNACARAPCARGTRQNKQNCLAQHAGAAPALQGSRPRGTRDAVLNLPTCAMSGISVPLSLVRHERAMSHWIHSEGEASSHSGSAQELCVDCRPQTHTKRSAGGVWSSSIGYITLALVRPTYPPGGSKPSLLAHGGEHSLLVGNK